MQITRDCIICEEMQMVEVPEQGYREWQNGRLIQNAMPEIPPETREMLISGVCPPCWRNLFDQPEQPEEEGPPEETGFVVPSLDDISKMVETLEVWAEGLYKVADVMPSRENWEAFEALRNAENRLRDSMVWINRQLDSERES